jgi:hypothetical protein
LAGPINAQCALNTCANNTTTYLLLNVLVLTRERKRV